MVIELTLTTILIFVGFVVTIFILYKLIKFFFRASLIVVASFAFPWIAKYFGHYYKTRASGGANYTKGELLIPLYIEANNSFLITLPDSSVTQGFPRA